MSGDETAAGDDRDHPSATAAFELLAHETRMTAMRVLWEADGPLRFSEVADRGDIADTGNFNYHFGKLVGHFVRTTGEKYELTRSGRQAMTAVLAGDVTDRPTFDPVTLEERCPYCDARIELHHDADSLRVLCSSCPGTFAGDRRDVQGTPNPTGTITTFAFPPAGLRERDPESVLDAALLRLVSRYRDMTEGVCPDCAGPIDRSTTTCTDHDPDGVCERCTSRFAGVLAVTCETCGNARTGMLALVALADPRARRYFEDHGHDPLAASWSFAVAFLGATEHVHSTTPVDYEATWTLDDETLRVRIGSGGAITDVAREEADANP